MKNKYEDSVGCLWIAIVFCSVILYARFAKIDKEIDRLKAKVDRLENMENESK